MAGAEAGCGAATWVVRPARARLGTTVIGLAVVAGALARLTTASAQDQGGNGAPTATEGNVAGSPPWTFTSAASVSETFTDNALSTATDRKADAITSLQPSLYINGQDPRLKGTFSYSPQALIYASQTNQDQVVQNLLANGTLTAIQDRLFVDANASISNSSRIGGRGFNNVSQIPTSQSTQTFAYNVAPYLNFRLGDYGDGLLRYSLGQTVFNGNTGAIDDTTTGQTIGAISDQTQQEILGKLSTGQSFARLQLTATSDNTFVRGGGGSDSNGYIERADGQYVIANAWSALFGGGYQEQIYLQQPQNNFTGPTWNVGARWQPREDRQASLTYGETYGHNTVQGNASWVVGLSTLSASYTVSNSTPQQQLLQNLNNATALPGGIIINPTTGLPQTIGNPNLALQNSVQVTKAAQVGVTTQSGQRDNFTTTFNRTEQNSLSSASLSQTTVGGTFTWGHEATPLVNTTVSVAYATTDSSGGTTIAASTQTFTLGANLNYQISETLTSSAGYAMSRQTGGVGGTILDDIVTLTLRKTF